MATSRKKSGPKEQDEQQALWNPVEKKLGEAVQKMSDSQGYVPNVVPGSVVTTNALTPLWKNAKSFAAFERTGDETKLPKTRKSVNNVAKITLSDDVLEKAAPLGEFQRAVLEAVLSEMAAGNLAWSSSMLYRTMTGKTNGESVSQEQQKMVDDAMTQLMYTPLHIDLHDFAGSEDIGPGDAVLDGPILPAERITMNLSGIPVSSYRVVALPIIFRFCSITKSITMTPISFLSIGISYTQRNIAILNMMQRNVAPLIYPTEGVYKKPAPLIIHYESIYEVALEGSSVESSFTVKQRIRETVHTILDTWAKHGYIAKWDSIKERRSYVAVRIFFPNRQPTPPPPVHFNILPNWIAEKSEVPEEDE